MSKKQPKKGPKKPPADMLKTIFTSLTRHKTHTILNITGLAVGIAACLLIFLTISFEKSFDNYHKDKERIYRLVSIPYHPGAALGQGPGAPLPAAAALRIDYPQLEKVASIFGRDAQVSVTTGTQPAENQATQNQPIEKSQTNKFTEQGTLFYAEPALFDIFSIKWLAGNPQTLTGPNKAAITKATAERYFGSYPAALGQTIKLDNKDIYQITGILEDQPANTDLPLKIVLSYASLKNVDLTDWQGIYTRGYTFIKLPENLKQEEFNRELRSFVDRHTPATKEKRGLALQPLSQMHTDARFGNLNNRTFSPELTTSLSLTAAFLLIIACVNFINLSTAQAVTRSREIAIRKVLGSSRTSLKIRFLGEAAIITIIAIIIATTIAKLTLPSLNNLLGTNITIDLTDPALITFQISIALVVTAMAGLYPAFLLSSFDPVSALKNKLTTNSSKGSAKGISLRRILVIAQFTIAQTLIICVLVVSSQMNFFRHADLGFDKTSIVNIPIPADSLAQAKIPSLRAAILAIPGVKSVSFSSYSPLDNDLWSSQFKFDHSKTKTPFQVYFKWADADFFTTYLPKLIAGRLYEPSDTLKEFVVNETLTKKLGFQKPEDIIGKEINFWDQTKGPVVGVVKDFYTTSLQSAIKPIVIGPWRDTYSLAGIKLSEIRTENEAQNERKTENETEAKNQSERQTTPAILARLRSIWTTTYPDYVYSYQFLDDKIDQYYKEEEKLSVLYKLFAAIAVFISCLGLYGLVSFMTTQRTKELGIRKILGATLPELLLLLSKEMTTLIAAAFLIATPVAWYLMHRWLETFANRIQPQPRLFLLTIAGSIAIAWITVGYRTFRAATANPVEALRDA